MEDLALSTIELGVALRPLPGQSSSGDLQVVKSFPGGVLIAVLDGVGHGREAAAAAAVAGTILEKHAADPVTALFQQCHEALRGTRGVTMSVASLSLSQGLVTWLGVGNVEGVLLRQSGTLSMTEDSLLLRGGVVGLRLPSIEAEVVPVSRGDTLIFATDGVQSSFARGLVDHRTPQRTAESILAQYGRASDDALVLVARFLLDRHENK
jgi:negative regulator of sigma-B (phosphoserine phosphatase)